MVSQSPFASAWQSSRMGVKVVRSTGKQAPAEWRPWVRELFPRAVERPFAPRHEEFWEHVWAIDYKTAPRPYMAVWPREGGKSTNTELATSALGMRGARRYAVYVRRTQLQADQSVSNIATRFETPAVEVYYPKHAQKLLGKFGNQKGWRRNRIRTSGGFTVDALGLDVASRGLKVEDDRPDLIIFDDIDQENDSPATIAKMIRTITRSILPAGAQNVAVILVQNLIHANGVVAQLVDGAADFLSDRMVSGPHPAVLNLKWEWKDDATTGTKLPRIVSGTPTWEGQSLEVCERQMRTWGPESFMREAQHEVKDRAEGLALNFHPNEHVVDATPSQLLELCRTGRLFSGMDFGAWRFAWELFAADEHGVARHVAEVFSQREEAKQRARRIHERCVELGIIRKGKLLRPLKIWGDAANPQDIAEMNAAWRDGWRDERTGKLVQSPLRVVAVGMGEKTRRASVTRINDKLAEGALKFIRSVGVGATWLEGWNAGSRGVMRRGCRLRWELEKWAYPVPQPGKQDLKQDPDDHTADGADGIAAMRYALMSFWRAAKPDDREAESFTAFSPEALEAETERKYTVGHRLSTAKRKRSTRIRHADVEEDD
jgi:hypothetical protein